MLERVVHLGKPREVREHRKAKASSRQPRAPHYREGIPFWEQRETILNLRARQTRWPLHAEGAGEERDGQQGVCLEDGSQSHATEGGMEGTQGRKTAKAGPSEKSRRLPWAMDLTPCPYGEAVETELIWGTQTTSLTRLGELLSLPPTLS